MQANRLLPIAAVVLATVAAVAVQIHLAGADSYQVRDGDTLGGVAYRLGVSVQELASANAIDDPNFIVAGQMLVVPSDGGSATEYLVRAGDNLWNVSDKVGVPVSDLAKVN